MAFNLKKFAVTTQEQRLQEQRDHYDTETKLPTSTTNDLLDEKRKNVKETPTYEGLLDDARTKEEYQRTVEGQLDDHKVTDGLPKRTGDDKHDQLPINLMAEVRDKERAKAFAKSVVKDSETEKWDKFLGVEEPLKDPSTQLQNHEDRFKKLTDDDVLKNQNVKDMVMASLKDADAMLYFIYHKASSEGRQLTAKEQSLVDGITADKVKLASVLYAE